MLSAVENHLGGPGRGTYFAAAGPGAFPPLMPPVPQVQIPTGLQPMSTSEFVRPHPKTRYNGGPVRNGISSPRSKYLQQPPPEQNGPVNLAVGPSTSPSANVPSSPHSMSPKDDSCGTNNGLPSPKENPLVEPFSPSRLPYPTSPAAAAAANMYQQALNYSLYSRAYPSLYPPPPHPLARSMQRPGFLPEAYGSPFMPSVPPFASQQASMGPQMPPQGQLPPPNGTKVHHSMVPPSPNGPVQFGGSPKELKLGKQYKESNNNMSPGFKVPSGKEGSLKHRIFTKPYDKDGKQRSPNPPAVNGSICVSRSFNNNNNNISTKNFTKGSLIELANGEIKRVEDMRTEDFILSAQKSSDLELADSTVVKMTPSPANNQMIYITFSYDNNRSKVDIDVTFDHPFFVYGKGWSSFRPESTFNQYGLKCQHLQVGDICISLKPREKQQRTTDHRPYIPSDSTIHHTLPFRTAEFLDYPQNLSARRSPATISTTATGTAVTSRPVPSLVDGGVPTAFPYPNHIFEMQRSLHHHSILEAQQSHRRPLSHENPAMTSLQDRYSAAIGAGYDHSQPIPMVVNKNLMLEDAETEASKKRRWSAPDNFGDNPEMMDEEHQRALMHQGKYSH